MLSERSDAAYRKATLDAQYVYFLKSNLLHHYILQPSLIDCALKKILNAPLF